MEREGKPVLVYLHLADGFEEIEALTAVDVLRRAEIEVKTLSISDSNEVRGAHNITVVADMLYRDGDYSKAGMIVLPGGMPGTLNLENHKQLMENVKQFYKDGKWLAAICAAPSIFGKLGLLKGKAATCYPGFEKYLKGAKCSNESVVVCENIVTSRGPGTAMDFALELVKILKGVDLSEKLKKDLIFYC